ncbi:MAG: hypothetical protein Q7R66_18260 [Undibacterium sp.]|nr:hypothetical protein [Undibacterium sp.]
MKNGAKMKNWHVCGSKNTANCLLPKSHIERSNLKLKSAKYGLPWAYRATLKNAQWSEIP